MAYILDMATWLWLRALRGQQGPLQILLPCPTTPAPRGDTGPHLPWCGGPFPRRAFA